MTDMTDPRHLLHSQESIPGPRAVALQAEVRTQSTLPFHTVHVPAWANPDPIGTLHEWRCDMTWPQVHELQKFLQDNLPPTQSTPEALVDKAMRDLQIGFYVGTFLGNGTGGSQVRMLFSYAATLDVQAIARAWAALLGQPSDQQKPAAEAISKLREFWNAGSSSSESGLMLLYGIDLDEKLGKADEFPFASIDRKFPGVGTPGR